MSDEHLLTNPYEAPPGIGLSCIGEGLMRIDDSYEWRVLDTPVRRTIYLINHRERICRVIETSHALGATVRIQGPIGLASAFALYRARDLGTPTMVFTETGGDPNLSLEWIHEQAEEMGAVEIRKQLDYVDRADINLEEIESYARSYLAD